MKTKKKNIYTHNLNCKVTEQQFNDLKTIKLLSGQSISKLFRDNISFLINFYSKK